MRAVLILTMVLVASAACERSAGELGDGGTDDTGGEDTGSDTGTGLDEPFTGWDACVYVYTGWFTKVDDCMGGSHWTAELIEMAEEFCEANWAPYCDFELLADQDLAYDCRFAIKVSTCEEWEQGLWYDDAACQELIVSIGCEFLGE
ncbi:MAG: hypothetical protein JRF63_12095 [Deltaproteobacteria bacterium]|nr:hypothetical protein [Deltaproteobacteria bacterium]